MLKGFNFLTVELSASAAQIPTVKRSLHTFSPYE